MKLMIRLTSGLIVASLFLGGCNLFAGNQANTEAAQQTAVAQTVVALQTALSAQSASTAIPVVATATPNIQPTITIALQPTAVPYSSPTATAQPAYLVTGVIDVTVPDGTVLKPGEAFTKTWRITNGGSATWSADFKLVYFSGDQMGAVAVALGRAVAPNQTIDVSVNLTAPKTEGTFQGNFMIQTGSGNNFGLGAGSASPFWVKIVTRTMFQVTSAVVNATPSTYTGVCPASVSLTATITSTGVGSVTYYFVTSTGNSSTATMTFGNAETKTSAAISWPVTGPAPLVVHVYIDSPNHQDFPAITIPVTCTP